MLQKLLSLTVLCTLTFASDLPFCACDNRGLQINVFDGDWCWLEEAPCQFKNREEAPVDWTWTRCSARIDCPYEWTDCSASCGRNGVQTNSQGDTQPCNQVNCPVCLGGDEACIIGYSCNDNLECVQYPEFDGGKCAMIAGTTNIHWTHISGNSDVVTQGCTGIEHTDRTVSGNSVGLTGTHVSDSACISTDAYDFEISDDGLTINGFSMNNVPMTLTRAPEEDCFTGHWVAGGYDFLAHIHIEVSSDPAASTSVCSACAGYDPSGSQAVFFYTTNGCFTLAEANQMIADGTWCCDDTIDQKMIENPYGCYAAPNEGGHTCYADASFASCDPTMGPYGTAMCMPEAPYGVPRPNGRGEGICCSEPLRNRRCPLNAAIGYCFHDHRCIGDQGALCQTGIGAKCVDYERVTEKKTCLPIKQHYNIGNAQMIGPAQNIGNA